MKPPGYSVSDSQPLQIGVLGGGQCEPSMEDLARHVGRCIAEHGATLVCGGRGGVMAAASQGAQEAGGRTVGILPGTEARDSSPNTHLDVRVFTGLGQGRNLCVVLSSDAVIAIAGEWGTLSEIALARKHDIPVVLLHSWSVQPSSCKGTAAITTSDIPRAESAVEAVDLVLAQIAASRRRIFPDTV